MKDYIYSDQQPLFGHRDVIGFGTDDFKVEEIPRELANKIIIENHYTKKHDTIPHNKANLGVYLYGDLSGVLQFGLAMNPYSYEKIVADSSMESYLELNRMWLSDECPRNSESRAISHAIKYIKKKHPAIDWIQSFADERCGKLGIVYQAANFKYYGEHTAIFWELDGETFHNSRLTNNTRAMAAGLRDRIDEMTKYELRQFRYLYFIHRQAQSKCLLKQQDYPKHYANP